MSKFPHGKSSPWDWWQPMFLRMEVKRRMKPLTPDVANKRRLGLSIAYFITAFITFHYLAYIEGAFSHKPSDTEHALNQMNEGKIIEMENLKIIKIKNFDSQDFDDKIKKTNRLTAIWE